MCVCRYTYPNVCVCVYMCTHTCFGLSLVAAINKLGGSILKKNFFKGGLHILWMGKEGILMNAENTVIVTLNTLLLFY